MERAGEHRHEALPVGAGVDEVEVPGFVNSERGGDWRLRDHSEGDEALVLDDDPLGELGSPALLFGKAIGERGLDWSAVDVECLYGGDEGLVVIHCDLQSWLRLELATGC